MDRDFVWKDETDLLWGALSSGGALLTVLDPSGRPNPMTIGWALLGIAWSRPTLSVLVRQNRFTYTCLQTARDFAVSVPVPGTLKDELLLCGTKSGRDIDKLRAAGLTPRPSRHISSPVVRECRNHYECRILARTLVALPDVDAEVVEKFAYREGSTPVSYTHLTLPTIYSV